MRKSTLTTVLLAAMASCTGVAPVTAQTLPACAEHEIVRESLASGYGETRQMIGIAADGSILEMYGNVDTGSWTITMTMPGGPTCLVASGENFEHLNETLLEPREDL